MDPYEDDDGLLDGFDVEDDGVVEKPKHRFYCAGAYRRDDDGRQFCDYRALRAWTGIPCPKCGRWYDCKKLKSWQVWQGSITRHEMTAADMDRVKPMEHHPTGVKELDLVIGGGLVFGKVTLLAGRPGGGKTRFLLQLAASFARQNRRVFFASGEDDRDSIVQFAHTLRQFGSTEGYPRSDHIFFHGNADGLVIDDLVDRLRYQHVRLLIVDSAQSIMHSDCESDYRTIEQINKCCAFLARFARQTKIAVIIIGQITEQGGMSGGSALKHGVDALVRMDDYDVRDKTGKIVPGSENVRVLRTQGKIRTGRANVRTFIEMADEDGSFHPLSQQMRQHVSGLKV